MAERSSPISIRLSKPVLERISAEARRLRRSRSAMIESLADEALRCRRFPGIIFKDEEPHRRAGLIGTGLDVWQMIELYRSFGSIEGITEAYNVDEWQVRLALAYYEEYPEEIDEAIRENNRPIEELRREYPWAGFQEVEID